MCGWACACVWEGVGGVSCGRFYVEESNGRKRWWVVGLALGAASPGNRVVKVVVGWWCYISHAFRFQVGRVLSPCRARGVLTESSDDIMFMLLVPLVWAWASQVIRGNLSPDLGMGLFGVRRMGAPGSDAPVLGTG